MYKYTNDDLIKCMNKSTDEIKPNYPLVELCLLADMPIRTVRYYVQVGLVDKPEGETRAARYGVMHLEQLLLIKKWTAAGVSLERIRELLQGEPAIIPPRPVQIGAIAVCSHIRIGDGVDLVIDPGRAKWAPEQLRHFVKGAMHLVEQMREAAETIAAKDNKTKIKSKAKK